MQKYESLVKGSEGKEMFGIYKGESFYDISEG